MKLLLMLLATGIITFQGMIVDSGHYTQTVQSADTSIPLVNYYVSYAGSDATLIVRTYQ